MNTLDLLFCFTLFTLVTMLTLVVDLYIPQPYMDEIFHADQMHKYCAGNFTQWNPKITTPPGLYAVTYLALMPLIEVLAFIDPKSIASLCSVEIVRLISSVFISVLYLFATEIIRKVSGTSRFEYRPDFAAFNICFFPILFFTSFLYYTDLLSLLSVLVVYWLYLKNLHGYAALASCWAILMRQTNVIWVVFCAGLTAFDILRTVVKAQPKKDDDEAVTDDSETLTDLNVLSSSWTMIRRRPEMAIFLFCAWIKILYPYILVFCGFITFIFWNSGLALGDKSAHQPVFHLAQFYYCIGATLFFGSPMLLSLSKSLSFLGQIHKRKLLFILATITMIISVYLFTFDHPYLLADNRHYTFYIWRKWFQRHWIMKYLLVPFYMFGLYTISHSLKRESHIWRLGFIISTLLVTVPHGLMEFRYYIVPYVIWRLHLPLTEQNKTKLTMEFCLYFIINLVTIYLFMFKPFIWSHETGTQRFMW